MKLIIKWLRYLLGYLIGGVLPLPLLIVFYNLLGLLNQWAGDWVRSEILWIVSVTSTFLITLPLSAFIMGLSSQKCLSKLLVLGSQGIPFVILMFILLSMPDLDSPTSRSMGGGAELFIAIVSFIALFIIAYITMSNPIMSRLRKLRRSSDSILIK